MRLILRRQPVSAEDPVAALSRQLLLETREELDRSDRKAQILFAAAGIGVSAVLGGIASGDWSPFDLPGWAMISWMTGATISLIGMLLLALAIFPRIRHSDPQGRVAYFGHVAQYSDRDALRAALKKACSDPEERTMDQLLTISRIVVRKYGLVSWGLRLVGCGFAIALITVVGNALICPSVSCL